MNNFTSHSSDPSSGNAEHHPLTLCPADAAIVDQLLDSPDIAPLRAPSGDPSQSKVADGNGHAPEGQRRARIERLLAALGSVPEPAAPADLLSRTLAAVKNDSLYLRGPGAQPQERSAGAANGNGMNLSRRLSQLGAIAVAASVLIAVLIPGIGQLRQKAYVTACASNLKDVQTGFASYAAANNGELPRLDNGDGNWLPHPQGHSNTANLLPLVEQNYVKTASLVCPARGVGTQGSIAPSAHDISDAQRSYSYVNMFGPFRPRWDGKPTTLILADRNPLFGSDACNDAQSNSANHRYAGTNVLAADGSVVFASNPDIGPDDDNIWTVREGNSYRQKYAGTEVTQSADDVFLSP